MPVPAAPMLDAESSAAGQLVAKGAGGTLFLETDDGQASYDDVRPPGRVQRSANAAGRMASTRRSVTSGNNIGSPGARASLDRH